MAGARSLSHSLAHLQHRRTRSAVNRGAHLLDQHNALHGDLKVQRHGSAQRTDRRVRVDGEQLARPERLRLAVVATRK